MTSETRVVWDLIQQNATPTAAQLVSDHRLSGWQSAQRIVEAVAPGEAVRARGALQTVRFQGINSWAVLHLGDCLDMLPIEADAVITDPPFGTGETTRVDGEITRTKAEWDVWNPDPLRSLLGRVALFQPPAKLLSENWEGWRLMAWCSENPMKWKNVSPRYGIQSIVAKGIFPDVASLDWRKHRNNIQTSDHPHQKPIPIMAWLVETITTCSETVLDPYMGSGSTGIACLRTGRNFVGIERDPTHFQTACDRFAREVDGQLL